MELVLMTEKKRFKRLEFDDGTVGVHDTHTQSQYYYSIESIDLLNEQQDRINELKKENTFLKEALEACTLDIKVAMQTLSRWE